MTRKLYVGNLSFGLDEGALRQAFESKGLTVNSVQIIMDKFTNRSRGFGFVELADSVDPKNAIEGMNGVELDGRPIKVSEAQERPRAPRGDFNGGGRGGFGSRDGGGRGGFGGGGGRGGRGGSRW